MINPSYCVKCLCIGFEAYKRFCKLPIYIKPSKKTVSFYVKKPMIQKGKDVRVSTHHPNLENYADDRNEPWLFDNVSIEFIVPNSEEDKETLGARVYQNASGTIQPFDVTVYQYDSTLIKVTDLITIFKSIIVFLNGGDYSDPFVNDPKKAAKVIPRTAKIKPYRGKTKIENRGFDDQHLQYIAEQCMKGIIEINCNRNMNKKLIRLTESDLHKIVKESVNKVLNEIGNSPRGQFMLGRLAARAGDNGDTEKRKEIEYYANQRKREYAVDPSYSHAQIYGLDIQPDLYWDKKSLDDNPNSEYRQNKYNNTKNRIQQIYDNLPNKPSRYKYFDDRKGINVNTDNISLNNYHKI